MAALVRRELDELLTRWSLAKIPTVFVEGEFDRRLLALLQEDDYLKSLSLLDVITPTDLNAPAALLIKHEVPGRGEKQRVIAISRELASMGAVDGFMGLVDRDLDPFIGRNFESNYIRYTDNSCFEVYLWSLKNLRRVARIFKADVLSDRKHAGILFASINKCCANITAVRVINERRQDWSIKLHHSDSSLSLNGFALSLDLPSYVSQCKPVRGSLSDVQAAVADVARELSEKDVFDQINGHDLIWLLTYALRETTTGPRRMVEFDAVINSLVAVGVERADLIEEPLFKELDAWAMEMAER